MACTTDEQKEADIKDFIRRRFGYPVVQVELSDEQLDDALQEAVRWFTQFIDLGKIREADLPVQVDTSRYVVADDVDKVVEVWFESPSDPFAASVAYAGFEYQLPQIPGEGGYADVVQAMQYLKDAKRILTADQDWWFNDMDRSLVIYPVPEGSTVVRYRYVSKLFDWSQISQYHEGLIRKRALFEAMWTLGQIRSKYSELPSSNGSMSLNGDTLLSEASSGMMDLDEKIRLVQKPMGFHVG